MKKLIVALCALMVLATACKKDKEPPAITKENIVGSYKMTGYTKTPQGGAEENLMIDYPACYADDIYKFNLDESAQYQDAGETCSGDRDGSWTLYDVEAGQKAIESTFIGGIITKFDWNILEITAVSSDDGTTIYKYTLTRQ